MDLNMPRDKETGKSKGFGFLMYEDQRSTVLAVDNLNGAKVLDKTLRVDHVKDYKQPKIKGEDGEWAEPEEQSLNAKPEMIVGMSTFAVSPVSKALNLTVLSLDDDAESDSSATSVGSIDPEDPMRDYLISKRKEEKALKKTKKSKSKGKHKDETPEERRARRARKKEKKARKLKSEGMKGVEDLLSSLGRRDTGRPRSPSPPRTHRRSPSGSRSRAHDTHRERTQSHSRPHSPTGDYGTRSRRPIQYSDDENRGVPYGRESRPRRNRDYD